MVGWHPAIMEQGQFWNERITVVYGPDWDDQIMVRNEDGVGRPATSSELREAVRYLPWLRRYLPNGVGVG